MRFMQWFVFSLILAVSFLSVNVSAQAPSPTPAQRASVEGLVLDAVTRKPIANVQVSGYLASELGLPVVTTDANGRFRLINFDTRSHPTLVINFIAAGYELEQTTVPLHALPTIAQTTVTLKPRGASLKKVIIDTLYYDRPNETFVSQQGYDVDVYRCPAICDETNKKAWKLVETARTQAVRYYPVGYYYFEAKKIENDLYKMNISGKDAVILQSDITSAKPLEIEFFLVKINREITTTVKNQYGLPLSGETTIQVDLRNNTRKLTKVFTETDTAQRRGMAVWGNSHFTKQDDGTVRISVTRKGEIKKYEQTASLPGNLRFDFVIQDPNCETKDISNIYFVACDAESKAMITQSPQHAGIAYVVTAIGQARQETGNSNIVCAVYLSPGERVLDISRDAVGTYSGAVESRLQEKCNTRKGRITFLHTTLTKVATSQKTIFAHEVVHHEIGHAVDNAQHIKHYTKDAYISQAKTQKHEFSTYHATVGSHEPIKDIVNKDGIDDLNNLWGTSGHQVYWRESPIEGFAERYARYRTDNATFMTYLEKLVNSVPTMISSAYLESQFQNIVKGK